MVRRAVVWWCDGGIAAAVGAEGFEVSSGLSDGRGCDEAEGFNTAAVVAGVAVVSAVAGAAWLPRFVLSVNSKSWRSALFTCPS